MHNQIESAPGSIRTSVLIPTFFNASAKLFVPVGAVLPLLTVIHTPLTLIPENMAASIFTGHPARRSAPATCSAYALASSALTLALMVTALGGLGESRRVNKDACSAVSLRGVRAAS